MQTGETQSKSDSEGEDCSSTDNGESTEEEDENLTSENLKTNLKTNLKVAQSQNVSDNLSKRTLEVEEELPCRKSRKVAPAKEESCRSTAAPACARTY